MIYKIYITDRLYKDKDNFIIPSTDRFYDLIYKDNKNPISGDEIVKEVIKNAGLVVIK